MSKLTMRDSLALIVMLSLLQLLGFGYLVWIFHEDWQQSRRGFEQTVAGWQHHVETDEAIRQMYQAVMPTLAQLNSLTRKWSHYFGPDDVEGDSWIDAQDAQQPMSQMDAEGVFP